MGIMFEKARCGGVRKYKRSKETEDRFHRSKSAKRKKN